MKNILVTGGAGFIGSNFVHMMLGKYDEVNIIVYDKLTYAGNLENLAPVAGNPHYHFHEGDICDAAEVDKVMQHYDIDTIVNFAAETHVDRSLTEPGGFIQTDVYGTYVLLEAAKKYDIERYHQISTDEVYGQVLEGRSVETDNLEARSPYSAAKAGIVGLTKAAAKELAHLGVRVNAIQPGLIRSAMTEAMPQRIWDAKLAEVPMGRAGEPSEVATVAVFLASDMSSYMTGAVLEVTGGRHL